MVAALGGPADLVEVPWRHLPRAPLQRPAAPAAAGVVTAIDVRAVGLAIVELGGGRAREDAAVDPAVGLTEVARVGEAVGERPLALVHARDEVAAQRAVARLQAAFAVGEEAPPAVPLVEAVDG